MRIGSLIVLALVTGCGQEAGVEGDAHDGLQTWFEGDGVTAHLDSEGRSPVMEAQLPYVRVIVNWDGGAGSRVEIRTRTVGGEWSEWQVPEIIFAEEGVNSGIVDAPAGSMDYQYRIPPAADAPTFVAFEPVEEVMGTSDSAIEGEPEVAGAVYELLDGRLRIHDRSEWGARPPRCAEPSSPNRITIHHTVTPTNDTVSVERRLRQIQAMHMNGRGWCDIGYNYLISRDGRVWMGRGATRMGAHVLNNNSGNVGISFMGDYTRVNANRDQREGAAALIAYVHRKWPAVHLTRDDIKGHRQYQSTACPGNMLYEQIGVIVQLSRTY